MSDYNLRLWLRAVRTENALSIDRVAEQLAYKNLQNPSVDTKYYLYILKFMQVEAGDYTARGQVSQLINECSRAARDLSRPSSSFEWLGAAEGLRGLLHTSTLGPWDTRRGLLSKPTWPEKNRRPHSNYTAPRQRRNRTEIGSSCFFRPFARQRAGRLRRWAGYRERGGILPRFQL